MVRADLEEKLLTRDQDVASFGNGDKPKSLDFPAAPSDDDDDDDDEYVPRRSPESSYMRRMSKIGSGQPLAVAWSAVILVYLINFMDSVGGNISTPILPFYGKMFGASNGEVGQLFSVFAFTQTLAMPVLGHLSDKFGRRNVLLLSLLGTMTGALWQGLATSYWSLFAARAFSGIWAGVSSVCQVYIVDVVDADDRVEYLGYLLSTSQASMLFGPSLGAGLSVLGLNVPLLVQACTCAFLLGIVVAYLPESPEWIRLHNVLPTPLPSPGGIGRATPRVRPQNPGMGYRGTWIPIVIYGVVAMCSMIAQMSVVSMFAVFAEHVYGLDSLRVGFALTLGAIASIGTNIWLSPLVQRKLGNQWSSVLGSCLIILGSIGTVFQPLQLTLVMLVITYLGIAINAGAVATGTANLTDMHNRSKVLMGVRMMKSFGAMAGPVVSGHFSGMDVRLPFVIASAFATLGGAWQIFGMPFHQQVQDLMKNRRTVGLKSALIEAEGWQDEYGTPEEIIDLGEYVANLLSTRHYRWVTYNQALKNCLSDFFPPLPVESEEAYKESYDKLRNYSRRIKDINLCDAQQMMMER